MRPQLQATEQNEQPKVKVKHPSSNSTAKDKYFVAFKGKISEKTILFSRIGTDGFVLTDPTE
jgi:hypothetical protein